MANHGFTVKNGKSRLHCPHRGHLSTQCNDKYYSVVMKLVWAKHTLNKYIMYSRGNVD